MSETLEAVQRLVAQQKLRISEHGYDELHADAIEVSAAIGGIVGAVVVEDYPDALKGPTVLVLQRDAAGNPLHLLWGIPKGLEEPAVLITAYRPDPLRWSADFLKRKEPWKSQL